jgi:hypothetical protein
MQPDWRSADPDPTPGAIAVGRAVRDLARSLDRTQENEGRPEAAFSFGASFPARAEISLLAERAHFLIC